MKKIFSLVLFALLAIVVGIAMHPFNASAATTYVSDTFTRSASNSWGSTSPGGTYALSGTASNFDVPSVVGQMTLNANTTLGAYLPVSARDVDVKVRVKRNKSVAGGNQMQYFAVRRVSNGTDYLGRIRFVTDGTVRLQGIAEVGSAQTMLGTETTVSGLTTAANTYIWLRGQVTGANPTTIKLKAWKDGQAEPSSWQYTVTDSNSSLQVAGGVGLRSYLATKATNAPVLFLFDDFTASSASSTTTGPTPTSAPKPTATPAPTQSAASSGSIYWGALVNGQAPSSGNLAAGGVFDKFEQNAGKKMAILHWGEPWKMNNAYMSFQTSYFTAVRNRGSIPYIDWSSWNLGSGANQSSFQLADIYNGTHDAYITQWAKDAKAWGHPFFLRLDWEMNGNWQYSWSEQLNGNLPGDFVKMWRHVHDIFKNNGATNVTWVWCPNIQSSTTISYSGLYPGDSYVDWTCFDGYNKYTGAWLSIPQIFNGVGITWLYHSYDQMVAVAPNKPIMIGETASFEAGDGGTKKGAWLKDMLQNLPSYLPKVKAIVYFNWNDNNSANTFPIESSSASISGFKQGVSSSLYPANNFANLNTSPIPPLQ